MDYYILYLASGVACFFLAMGGTYKLPPAALFQRMLTPSWVVSLGFFIAFIFHLFLWPLGILLSIWLGMTKKPTT